MDMSMLWWGGKKLLVQFEDGQKKQMSCVSLPYLFSKYAVFLEMDDPISDLPQNEQGGLLTIDGDPVVEET